jgi:hypothetical protein
MSTNYRIFCIDEETWKYQWTNTAITECPTDNLHAVNPDSVSPYSMLKKSNINCVVDKTRVHDSCYTKIASFVYTLIDPVPLYVKIVSQLETPLTSYTLKIFNITKNEELFLYTGTNNATELIDLGSSSTVPDTDDIIEVYVKVAGANGTAAASISNIVIYIERVL